MKAVNSKIQSSNNHEPSADIPKKDVLVFLKSKIETFQEIIKKTILAVQKYKFLDILGANEINVCIQSLESLFCQLNEIYEPIASKTKIDTEYMISKLQEINNELSSILKSFGTECLEDLITVCFGSDFIDSIVTDNNRDKFQIINKYVHPIGYKVMVWKGDKKKTNMQISKNKIVEDFMIVETSESFDCFDLARTSKSYQTKVYGIKIAIQHSELKKTLIICGVVDEIMLDCLNYNFIDGKIHLLIQNKPKDPDFQDETFDRFTNILTIKELLIYSEEELYNRYVGYLTQLNLIKQKTVSHIVKEFINSELYSQRTMITQLLLKSNDPEFQYLAYLLYDLLSNDVNGNIDTQEQTMLFDSLPWNIKKYFRYAMKTTIQYTNDLCNFDNSKIPLEQQICLLKVNDIVKEKAMCKLKEVKAKSEDSGSKARQYLEGLLKIPFSIYRHEAIMDIVPQLNIEFKGLVEFLIKKYNQKMLHSKEKFTCLEIDNTLKNIKGTIVPKINNLFFKNLHKQLLSGRRPDLIVNICNINTIIKLNKLKYTKLCHSGKKASCMRHQLEEFINFYSNDIKVLQILASKSKFVSEITQDITKINRDILEIDNKITNLSGYMNNSHEVLDDAVHGHKKAKRQIERIIGQWVNGDNTGYCFGFEGPPGVGKTSLAKTGISQCLKGINGESRPFAFIAIGGSSNGSTIDGHNYTYVGSTWGRIVDILMETKCMNPIIFIDELDKVSNTEHGREIIGILTHLIDPTQNDTFQDKYFSGIDIDLSKALFIFSYNDPSLIDRILLDRIHRVKFSHLTDEEKIVITNKYIIPEVTSKMGLEEVFNLSDDIIKYIIREYTCEPGVRKLKEILFEIIGEINLKILNHECDFTLPIELTEEDIQYVYLKERHQVRAKKIHDNPTTGIINGLWANALGKGGIIPIESSLCFNSTMLDLKLTGLQGDVMKESMNVAKTLAWGILTPNQQKDNIKKMEETKYQGIHIHCPEGAVPKDGPSAGTAITVVIHSLLSGKKIKNYIAITGEINLQGFVTAIGGLDLKFLGGIQAGVKEFIFPEENDKEFNEFMEKYKDKQIIQGIKFNKVSHIKEVLKLVYV